MKKLTALTALLVCLAIARAQEKPIYITGTVNNNTDSLLVFSCNDADPISQSTLSKFYNARIYPDGRFSVMLKARTLKQWSIRKGQDVFYIILHPGDSLRLDITGVNTFFDYKAEGRYANDANFEGWLYNDSVYQHDYVTRDYTSLTEKKDYAAILIQLKEQRAYELARIDEYNKLHPLSPAFYKRRKAQFTYMPYQSLWSKMDKVDTSLLFELPFTDDEAAGTSIGYTELAVAYFFAHITARLKTRQPTLLSDRLQAIDSLFTGRTRQLLLCDFLTMLPLDGTPPLSLMPEGAPYLKRITDSDFVRYMDYTKTEYQKMAAVAKASAEQIDQHASLDSLLAEYKGKVVYIDFWASWCVPCRLQIPYSHRLEEKYKGKDIVFLYLAYNDGKAPWLKARADLDMKGAQYLLNEKECEEARNKYSLMSIPHYLVIDKSGKVVDSNAPKPLDAAAVEEKLNALLQ